MHTALSARARRVVLPVAMAAAVVCVAVWASWADPAAPAPDLLLPDLSAQPPAHLALRAARRDGHARLMLGFRSAADNVGRGPLTVDAQADPAAPRRLATTQVISRADGSEERRPLPARLRFVRSRDHSHFHYLGFMRYALSDPRSGRRVGRDRKTGFCLGDRYETHPGRRTPGKPRAPVFDTDCGKARPGLRSLREGISVGYGDDYDPHLEGQEIDVTRVRAGRYLLVHTVNPGRSLAERGRRNNVASALIRLVRREGGGVTVKLLARCRASARCRG